MQQNNCLEYNILGAKIYILRRIFPEFSGLLQKNHATPNITF
jgi:hypothetical protein